MIRSNHPYFAFVLLSICSTLVLGDRYDFEIDGTIIVRLRHYLSDDGNPEDRGNLTIQSIRTGSVALSQAIIKPHHLTRLKALAKNDQLYRMQATVVTSSNKVVEFLTFMKACALVESGFSDVLTVNLDHSGGVIAISASAPYGICQGAPIPPDEKLRFFNTTIVVRHMDNGPVPDTATYIQKMERERDARERGDQKDNRSFIAKYWMYIVPLLIFVLLSSAGQPEGAPAAAR
ncbi:ER membrane protein complex subunit 10 isoform X2 [Thrips palmi]|uniref:ER membrane protein complex subunit 10 n=1 Tax=Thrips palmi TaxID=161013 RepID=A0A6P8YSD2_THRPL|nr:ER membrane protein complex subunit 10 isoform X2 [Thrips palmi]